MLSHPAEGIQIACQMRQDPQLKDVPIIFISAGGAAQGADYAREHCPVELRAEMFLDKPLDAATLRAAVGQVFARRS